MLVAFFDLLKLLTHHLHTFLAFVGWFCGGWQQQSNGGTAAVYKAQYKVNNAHESWTTIGSYGSESEALNAAIKKKNSGALMVRVVDKNGSVVYSS